MSVQPPTIPDYALLRSIGRGAYGEVWLARGVTGLHRAVKIVFRAGFSDDRPYEREFSGIKRFQAVSHSQENLVNILHVGRNDAAGYFFYVMELADPAGAMDAVADGPLEDIYRAPGSDLNAGNYQSGTLKQLMRTRGRLPVPQCLTIAKGLSRAVEHLHRHGLIHRDIKPSNVIFVNRVPKLADIGLVAGLDESRSFVGTEGFVPPEGPGTVGSDLFALGRLLYEMSSGRDRMDYPRLPEDFDQLNDRAALLEFNEIVLKAGDPDRQRRYASAEEVVRDLLLLEAGKSVRRLRLLETRFALALRAAAVAILVTLVAVAAWLWATFQAREAHRNYVTSERHRLAAEAALRDVLLNQVRANRQSGWTGQRLESLRLLRENPSITNNLAFRSEAIACLALPDAQPLRSLPLPRGNPGARWATDRNLTRYATNDPVGNIWIRSVADDRLLHVLPSPGAGVFRFGFSEDDEKIGASYLDRRFVVWPLRDFPASLDKPEEAPAWSAVPEHIKPNRVRLPVGASAGASVSGGLELAVLDNRGQLHLVNVTNGSVSRALTLDPIPGSGVRFNASGLKFAGVRSNDCVLYRASDGARLFTLAHGAPVTSVTWHPDGRRLATTCYDFKVRMWDAQTGQLLGGFEDHEAETIGVDFDESGTLFASSSWDDTTRLWSPESARPLVRIRGGGNGARLAADGTRLVYSTWNHERLVFTQIIPGRERVSLQRAHGVYGLAFSLDGRLIAAGNSEAINIWQWPYYHPVAALPVSSCSTPAFTPDGRRIITAGYGVAGEWPFEIDDARRLLKLGPAREVTRFKGDSSFNLSRDGRQAALTRDRQTLLISRQDDRWEPGLTLNFGAAGVSFSPDLKWRAFARGYNRLEIQDAQGRSVTNFNCANATVSKFSPDGRWLVLALTNYYQAHQVGSWQPGPTVLCHPPGKPRRETLAFAAQAPLGVFRTDDRLMSLVDLDAWQILASFPVPLHTTAATLCADGSKLGVATEKLGLEVWDLAQIRVGLSSMGLDWSTPIVPLPEKPPPLPPRLESQVLIEAPRLTNESPALAARLPKRPDQAPANCLDLSNYYNASLADGWIPSFKLGTTPEHNLPIPPGVSRLAEVDFDVRGVIQLASSTLAARNGRFPDEVGGIPVRRRCQRIHFLHGTDWRGKPGALVGAYAVRYMTGEEEIVWITYGRDLVDWWVEPTPAAGTNAPVVAWVGTNAASRRQNSSIRVYRTTWENPRWDLPVQSIDFASLKTATGPFLLAITVE